MQHGGPALKSQLPVLPPFDAFWAQLPYFFDWLEGGEALTAANPIAGAAAEEVVRMSPLHLPLPLEARICLERICFGALNRLCVRLRYGDSDRCVEPYSLRHTERRGLLLYAYSIDESGICGYSAERIEDVQVTDQTFAARFAVELI